MYAAFLIATVAFGRPDRNTLGLLIGGAFTVALGIADDRAELKARHKLLGQIAAAVIVLLFGVKIEFVTNPFGGMIYLGLFSIPITVVWIVAFMNVVNFIDGLDGLAAGVSAIGSLAMAAAALGNHQSRLAVLSLALAGSALGFLRYNFNPARIFMGDAGAMFLGFTLAAIGMDNVTGQLRLTFGFEPLMKGFDFLIAVIGLFGIGEILLTMEEGLAFKGKSARISPKVV